MSDRRILKWSVSVDDQDHPIGSGRVVHVGCQTGPNVVQVWTDEPDAGQVTMRPARVYGTGQPLPESDEHLGSVVTEGGMLVWHVLARRVPIELGTVAVELGEGERLVLTARPGEATVLAGTLHDGRLRLDPGFKSRSGVDMLKPPPPPPPEFFDPPLTDPGVPDNGPPRRPR